MQEHIDYLVGQLWFFLFVIFMQGLSDIVGLQKALTKWIIENVFPSQ